MGKNGDHDLRAYPEYKDSGLPWLGRVPAHWETRRNGRLFAQRNETGFGSLPILEVSLRTGVRVRDMGDMKRKQVMSDREKYKRAVKGDIAYNMMRMWQGAVGVAPVDGLVSPAYVVARPYAEAEPRYFSYLFRTDAYKSEVDGYSRGIVKDRNRLYWEDFKRMPSSFPPPDEQKSIADYLDANAAIVRRFIRNRRRLIEVLNEQKQAIINRAVTRGLDPNGPLKPSGIDWLGDIPADWRLLPGRACFQEKKAVLNTGMKETTVLSLSYGRLVVKPPDKLHGLVPASFETYQMVDVGDIVIRPTDLQNDWKSLRFGLSHHRGIITSAYMCFRTTPHMTTEYGYLLLHLYDVKKVFYGLGSGLRQNLRWEDFKYLPCVVPPMDEQPAIVAHVHQETKNLDVAIGRAEREIDLIREYRTRLITDVVTGKLDVRHLAPSELPPEDEIIGETDLAEGIDDEDVLGDDEPELAEEAADADD